MGVLRSGTTPSERRLRLRPEATMGPPSPTRSPSPSRRTAGGRTNRVGSSPHGGPLLSSPVARLSPLSPIAFSRRGTPNPYATFTASALKHHRDVLHQEVDRLRNTHNEHILGPLPSPCNRRAELPGRSEFGRAGLSKTAPLRSL